MMSKWMLTGLPGRHALMESCIPNAMLKLKRNVPWMNRAIADAIKRRNALFRAAKCSGQPLDRAKYNLKRNELQRCYRRVNSPSLTS